MPFFLALAAARDCAARDWRRCSKACLRFTLALLKLSQPSTRPKGERGSVLIVKPYGRSVTRDDRVAHKRLVDLTDAKDVGLISMRDLPSHHPEYLMAHWVGTLDKIATKPKSNGPTHEQRALRELIFDAAWNEFSVHLSDEDRAACKIKWLWKTHPYDRFKDGRQIKAKPWHSESKSGRAPSSKGRWYRTFIPDTEPASLTPAIAADVARSIARHLETAEFRLGRSVSTRNAGRISAIAQSIETNVHSERLPTLPAWSPSDWKTYVAAGDVAQEIYREAQQLARQKKQPRASIAGAALFNHFARVFGSGSTFEKARQKPSLLAIHDAVKSAYKAIFDRKTVRAVHLPKNTDELCRLLQSRSKNQDIAALIRLGKVIHYEAASAENADSPALVANSWPTADRISNSHYWTSDGLTKIKRNEALVRVWRGVVAHANRTLRDWAFAEAGPDIDIFGKKGREEATGPNFDAQAFDRKASLLFGSFADRLSSLDVAEKDELLLQTIEGWEDLRNSSFHFKGQANFFAALKQGDTQPNPSISALFDHDQGSHDARLRSIFHASFMAAFFDQSQLDQIYRDVRTIDPSHAPQPRFRRILERNDVWPDLHLPGVPNRTDLESHPARLAQYTSLKLLYERQFPVWLGNQPAERLNGWIAQAKQRASDAAIELNGDAAQARVNALPMLQDGEHYATFVDRLQAITTTEFRVRHGYESDPEKAREQSAFLEKFRCDIVVQAFAAFIVDQNYSWLIALDAEQALPHEPRGSIESLSAPETLPVVPQWVKRLYFLMHLVPADEISLLLHQLRKWQLLETRSGFCRQEDIHHAMAAMALYLDMHDARFDGGAPLAAPEPVRALYECPGDFDELFTRTGPGKPDRLVPVRGLREIQRFGGLEPLSKILEAHPIRHHWVEQLFESEGIAAAAQLERENLHRLWIERGHKGKRELSHDELQRYRRALKVVERHRHISNDVYLNSHIRLAGLLTKVLARLVDYVGLWERDLYFTSLALIHQQGLQIEVAFPGKSRKALRNGQIVEALRGADQRILGKLEQFFGSGFLDRDSESNSVAIRNNIAHFNMLRADEQINLTALVNQTRRLVAYDRKLKNAVTTSIIGLCDRYGLILKWQCREHQMVDAELITATATHLGGKGGVTEALNTPVLVHMAAALFGQQGVQRMKDPSRASTPHRKRHRQGNIRGQANRNWTPQH